MNIEYLSIYLNFFNESFVVFLIMDLIRALLYLYLKIHIFDVNVNGTAFLASNSNCSSLIYRFFNKKKFQTSSNIHVNMTLLGNMVFTHIIMLR